jgi:integrase
MKMREPFRLPLSRQALVLLEELHAITGTGKYLFPEPKRKNRPLEVYRLNTALRELGFGADVMQAHGFRSTASTILNEHSDFSPDSIELALAHQPRGVRAIYNRSKRWGERCELAQWYADHLDGLRGRGEIVALPKTRRQ